MTTASAITGPQLRVLRIAIKSEKARGVFAAYGKEKAIARRLAALGFLSRHDACDYEYSVTDAGFTKAAEERPARFEVLVGNMQGWVVAKVAKVQPSGWLHYELSDGTNGLAQPRKWRAAE